MNATHYRTYVNGKNEHVCSLSEIHFHHRNTPLKLVLPKLHIQLCGFKNLVYLLMNACYVWYTKNQWRIKFLLTRRFPLLDKHQMCAESKYAIIPCCWLISHLVQCEFLSNTVLVGKRSVVSATSLDRFKKEVLYQLPYLTDSKKVSYWLLHLTD